MAGALIMIRTWLATAGGDREKDRGASLVEYALLIALIAIVCFVAVGLLGQSANSSYESVATGFPAN